MMPDLGAGLLGCYRCGYVWRFRKSPVSTCPHCKSLRWDSSRAHRLRPSSSRKGMGISAVIGPRRRALLSLATRFGARDVRVFGSVARGEAGPKSDIDLLVRFDEPVGLFGRIEFQRLAEGLLGRKVDIASERNLHWLIRPEVLAEAVPV
jgi:uncharacterized protein